MQSIKKKLHSQSGASFLFALLAFLVASMVAITIITAAVTSMKRIYSDREEQQAHLTLTSAARLIRDEMGNTRYIIKTITSTDSSGIPNTEKITDAEGTFAAEMKEAVESVDTYGSQYKSNSTAFTLRVDGLDMNPVDVSFIMQAEEGEKYKVIFTLSLEGSGETVFLTMDGSTPERVGNPETITDPEDGSQTTTEINAITWRKATISGIGK